MRFRLPLPHQSFLTFAISQGFRCKYVREWGGEGNEQGKFKYPAHMVLFEDELFVADSGNNRVQVFAAATGRFIRQWSYKVTDPKKLAKAGETHQALNGPYGIAILAESREVCCWRGGQRRSLS